MRERDVKIVQDTFEQIALPERRTAEIFYNRLFETDPELRHLFRIDINIQGEVFMKMLRVLVLGLGRIYEITPTLQDLGLRHVGYGVKDKDYDTFGNALVYAIRRVMANDFTPEVEAAWGHAYTTLSSVMKKAKRKVA